MNTKLLIVITFVFYSLWKRGQDSFLLFCTIHALILTVCVFFYQMENFKVVKKKKK